MLLCAGALIVSTEPAMQRHPAESPRVVLDTNASLALFAYADSSCASLLAALREGRLQAVANLATRTEWLQVLARDALKLDDKRRNRAVQLFDALVTTIGPDPAAAGAASALVDVSAGALSLAGAPALSAVAGALAAPLKSVAYQPEPLS